VEETLRESEERYRALVENASDIVFRTDGTGHFTFINPAALRITGYEEKEIIGRHYPTLIRPDMQEEAMNFFGRQFVKGIPNTYSEYPVIVKDGREIWLGQNTQLIFQDGKVVAFQAVARDITDRKRVEVALKESEEKYRSLFDNAVEGVFQTTPEGRFLSANPAQAKLFGYDSPQELMEQITNIGRQHYVNPEDRETYKNTLERDGVIKGFETQLINKDGSSVWASISARAVGNDEGVIIYYEGTLEDITARKQAEEERQNLEERLNRAEKMESLGTLAGGVAHDLNNVLGIVVGYAELILMNADESSSIRPHLVNIMSGGMKAAAIVDDLLTLARRGVSGRDVLNLNKIIADFQRSPEFEKLYSYHPSVKIKTDLEADLSNISGSSVHLVKSLYNLISNASEAMTKGGIVTIKTTNQYLDKPIQGYDQIRAGDYVVISVSDTGEGIPAADLKRIFEPFYTKKVMGRSGTGLGLAVVWGTVKDHHGYINVESEEGKGSAFTLYFPVTRGDITAEAASIAISEYMGNGESILVVDDVKEQRDLAAGMLRTLNYNVSSVSSGEEAVAHMKEHKVDLMVLDMIMDPGMDGLDTYRSVLEIRPQQKAIIVSGFSESDRVRAAKDLGAGAYVRKPYIKEKLGLAVRKEMDRDVRR
jgi:PAS domain S-box-containing protein